MTECEIARFEAELLSDPAKLIDACNGDRRRAVCIRRVLRRVGLAFLIWVEQQRDLWALLTAETEPDRAGKIAVFREIERRAPAWVWASHEHHQRAARGLRPAVAS